MYNHVYVMFVDLYMFMHVYQGLNKKQTQLE